MFMGILSNRHTCSPCHLRRFPLFDTHRCDPCWLVIHQCRSRYLFLPLNLLLFPSPSFLFHRLRVMIVVGHIVIHAPWVVLMETGLQLWFQMPSWISHVAVLAIHGSSHGCSASAPQVFSFYDDLGLVICIHGAFWLLISSVHSISLLVAFFWQSWICSSTTWLFIHGRSRCPLIRLCWLSLRLVLSFLLSNCHSAFAWIKSQLSVLIDELIW